MIYRLLDAAEFKEKNLRNWEANAEFWLQGRMRHLFDVQDMTADILQEALGRYGSEKSPRLIDFGCGEGWLLRLIQEKAFLVDYVGIDFNEKFITNLSIGHRGQPGVSFLLHDIERPLPEQLVGTAHVVANFFSFFEIPDITQAFANAAAALRSDGTLIVLTIDPIIQLVAISHSWKEFIDSLQQYESGGAELAYDKEIDVRNGDSGRIYKGILYSAAKYVETAKACGLQLIDMRELVKTACPKPQIYQYMVFHK